MTDKKKTAPIELSDDFNDQDGKEMSLEDMIALAVEAPIEEVLADLQKRRALDSGSFDGEAERNSQQFIHRLALPSSKLH